MIKSGYKKTIKLLVSLVFLLLAFSFLDFDSLKAAIIKVNPWVFAFAVLLALLHFLFTFVRWYVLIFKIAPIPIIEHIRYYFYGNFLNIFTPANLGGDVYRVISLKPHTPSSMSVVKTLMQERLIGLLSFFLFYLVSLLGLVIFEPTIILNSRNIFVYAGGIILLGTVGVMLLPLFLGCLVRCPFLRSRNWLLRVISNIHDAANFGSLSNFLKLLGISFLSLVVWILTVHVVAMELNVNISLLTLGVIVVLVELVRLVPVTIQGIGAREGMFACFVGIVGESPESGFVLGAVCYLALTFSILISGVVGLCLKYYSRLMFYGEKG